jgi:hypothetical protein
MSISTKHLFIAGFISYPGSFVFGAVAFPFIVVPIHALCMTAICIPWEHTALVLKSPDRWEMAPAVLMMFAGWLIKLAIPYLLGRGVHSVLT